MLMIVSNQRAHRLLAPLAVAGLFVVGCGDEAGLDKRFPVSGTVKYKGQPIAKGSISFIPEKPEGRGASGLIENGAYSLTTQTPGDGAFPGNYAVIVSALDVDLSGAEAEAKKKGATSVFIPQDMVAKANKNAKNAVPSKYSEPEKSGLKGEVKTQSNTIDFELAD